MNITYFTVASTRCMGIWRDELVSVPGGLCKPPKEIFNGFETREAAETFIRCYPVILERGSKYIRNAKVEQKENGEFLLTYETECGWGEYRRWKETHFYMKVNEYSFNLVPGTKDFLTLTLK